MDGMARKYELPAMRPFPAAANLLIETPGEGRTAAMAVLQAAMFRILTSLPPGMVRFTIIDPIGIGRNFGAFMHLADLRPGAGYQPGLDRSPANRGAPGGAGRRTWRR